VQSSLPRVCTIATWRSCAPTEMVLLARGEDRVHGDSHVAVGAVLKPTGRQAGCQLAVHLAFGGTRADRAPDTRSPMYCGEITSRTRSRRALRPVDAHQQVARDRSPR